jgi:hypothetical protein
MAFSVAFFYICTAPPPRAARLGGWNWPEVWLGCGPGVCACVRHIPVQHLIPLRVLLRSRLVRARVVIFAERFEKAMAITES